MQGGVPSGIVDSGSVHENGLVTGFNHCEYSVGVFILKDDDDDELDKDGAVLVFIAALQQFKNRILFSEEEVRIDGNLITESSNWRKWTVSLQCIFAIFCQSFHCRSTTSGPI